MFGRTASTYVLLALGLTAAPVLAQDGTIYDQWANFYDDQECSVNGGISVSLNNDGCLNERKSGKYSPSSDIVRLGLDHDLPIVQRIGGRYKSRNIGLRFLVRPGRCVPTLRQTARRQSGSLGGSRLPAFANHLLRRVLKATSF